MIFIIRAVASLRLHHQHRQCYHHLLLLLLLLPRLSVHLVLDVPITDLRSSLLETLSAYKDQDIKLTKLIRGQSYLNFLESDLAVMLCISLSLKVSFDLNIAGTREG